MSYLLQVLASDMKTYQNTSSSSIFDDLNRGMIFNKLNSQK